NGRVSRIEDLPFLQNLELMEGDLKDLQQHSFWLHIKKRKNLRLEILGRSLRAARLWKDGSWLEDMTPTITTFTPIPGQPMTHIEFYHDINPGLYLLTCYGGPAQLWTKESALSPFFLRMGIPHLGKNGQLLHAMSPFGRDTFSIHSESNFVQLVRENKKESLLYTAPWRETQSRYGSRSQEAGITKKSRNPWCKINRSAGNYSGNHKQLVVITTAPGDRVELDFFVQNQYCSLQNNHQRYWVSSIHSAEARDAIDITAILQNPYTKTPAKSEVITVSPAEPVVRKNNLLKRMSVFLYFKEGGTYVVDEDPDAGAKGYYQIKPFMTSTPSNYKEPAFQKPGTGFEVTAGYHVLTITPQTKGILHFALHKKSNRANKVLKPIFSNKEDPKPKSHPANWSLVWPEVTLAKPFNRNVRTYSLYLNQRPEVVSGFIVRKLPLNLEDPLPVPLKPGDSVTIEARFYKDSKINIDGGKFSLKIDNVPRGGQSTVLKGVHKLELENRDDSLRLFNVTSTDAQPPAPPPAPVLKPIEESFPILTETNPIFENFNYKETKQMLLQVKSPALYRLETTGRMAATLTVSTRATTSLFFGNQNGIGRNALVQQYLRAGDYLVKAGTIGSSKGRMGIRLKRTPLADVRGLTDGMVKRRRVAADAAVRYEMSIDVPGRYHLETYRLGKAVPQRLEDCDGWPLSKPGRTGSYERFFKKGSYFYYSLPEPVESRRVTFLKRMKNKREISGKGPHVLNLNESLDNIWMEDKNRSPDIYEFKISAPLEANLHLDKQMSAVLFDVSDKKIAATSKGNWQGLLQAGSYGLSVTCTDKNNRLPYKIILSTKDLVPGLSQTIISLPVEINVGLDTAAPVDISSFGELDVRASLSNPKSGKIIAEVDDRANDWNFRISRNLDAGRYRLKLSRADTLHGSNRVIVRMNTRKQLVTQRRALPFSMEKTIAREVIKIPLFTGPKDNLVRIVAKSGGSLTLVLKKGDRLLAEGENLIYIPLLKDTEYTLLAWSQEGAPGKTTIDAKALNPVNVEVTNDSQRVPVNPAVRLINKKGLSFRLKTGSSGDVFYYSPTPERPCLMVKDNVEGTLDANTPGWLAGSGKPVTLESIKIKSGGSIDAGLNEVPLTFKISHAKNEPVLVDVKSVNGLLGVSIFRGNRMPANPYRRSGMLATFSRTLAGFPGGGEFLVHSWLTAEVPAVVSEKKRFDSAEGISVSVTAFPKEKELDFRSLSKSEAAVEPGRSVWLQLNEEPQLLEMTLARGLVAFSWHKGHAVSMAAALEKNGRAFLPVKGEGVYVLNTGSERARFRAEKRGELGAGPVVFDDKKGFEKILFTPGTLLFQLPVLPHSTSVFVAGSEIAGRIWGTDGKIYKGGSTTKDSNFNLEVYHYKKASGGFLEITHGPGLVKVWSATDTEKGLSVLGHPGTAANGVKKAVFTGGMGHLSLQPQVWEFSIKEPKYVSIETESPAVLVLESAQKTLYTSMRAFRGDHRLNYYLERGNYRLLARQLDGAESPGMLRLQKIAPLLLVEGQEHLHRRIIRPGEIQVFRFNVKTEGRVGVGLKSGNDSLEARLYDAGSNLVTSGPFTYKTLPSGDYLLVVHTRDVPVQYTPLILGTKGSREGVPRDVIQKFKEEDK
ncbi:MAG: hypothetical protein GY757_58370, partial [bacterium]|nr:hypothetical protein [bacterium]